MRIFLFLLPFIMLALTGGCTKESGVNDLDLGYDYFPLSVGRVWEYEVDSIIFREAPGAIRIDSTRTLVREVVADSLLDNSKAILYRIERYERRSASEPWSVRAVWTASLTQRQALRTEDNLRFIKLVFPLHSGESWDGNAFLPEGLRFLIGSREVEIFKGWEYTVESVDEPAQIAGRDYTKVATIRQADFESVVDYRYAVEQYARGVGLVYREWRILDTQCKICCGTIGPKCSQEPWRSRAESGLILRQRLTGYY